MAVVQSGVVVVVVVVAVVVAVVVGVVQEVVADDIRCTKAEGLQTQRAFCHLHKLQLVDAGLGRI